MEPHDPELRWSPAARVAMKQRFFDRDHPRAAHVERDPRLTRGAGRLQLIGENSIVIRSRHMPVIGQRSAV
jgi:hypothetical protein